MQCQPYLYFGGRCEEAAEFYREVLGAEVVTLLRYKDSPEPRAPDLLPPGAGNKLMHMKLRIGDNIILCSDGRCEGRTEYQGFALSLTLPDETRAERLFSALAVGGKVSMPLGKTFFSTRFGIVTDRYGVSWMVTVVP